MWPECRNLLRIFYFENLRINLKSYSERAKIAKILKTGKKNVFKKLLKGTEPELVKLSANGEGA